MSASRRIVLQNSVFANEQNFQEALAALIRDLCGGSHRQAVFQPVTFVCSLQGIRLPNGGFDGRAAKFCRRLILEFCNTIRRLADIDRWLLHKGYAACLGGS
jgi:hypothetical protein